MIDEFETKELTPEFLKNYIDTLYDLNDGAVLFPEGFFVTKAGSCVDFDKSELKEHKFIDFKTGKTLNAMDYLYDFGTYIISATKHCREYSQRYNNNFRTTDKLYYGDIFCHGLKSDLWQGCSPRKFGMFVVYKNDNGKDLYGVIDEKEIFLINFGEYDKVELLPNYNVYLIDKNNNNYIYSQEYGLNKINISEHFIKFEASLNSPYYIITINDKENDALQGLIDKKGNILIEPIYEHIYVNNENMICGYNEKESNYHHIFNDKMEKIATIEADVILFFDTYSLYQKDNIIYTLNLKTKKLNCFNLPYVKDESDNQINIRELRNLTEEQLNVFIKKYPYYEEELGHIILHKTKKYGIKLTSAINNKCYKRYFKNKRELEKIEKYISDMFWQDNLDDRLKTSSKTLKKR